MSSIFHREYGKWNATLAVESKQLIEFWTADTRNFSPANVSFRHRSAELPVKYRRSRLNLSGELATIRELAIAGDITPQINV
jgi:hypothetical protein